MPEERPQRNSLFGEPEKRGQTGYFGDVDRIRVPCPNSVNVTEIPALAPIFGLTAAQP